MITEVGKDTTVDDDDDKEIKVTMNQPSLMEDHEPTDESITTHGTIYKICYGTNEDFQDMFHAFWPFFMNFVSNFPDHDHTKQLQNWFQNGLSIQTDLNTIKKIVGVDNLDQLLVVMRDSPALSTHFDLQWDHKIMYHMKEPQVLKPSLLGKFSTQKKYTVKSCMDTDMEFCILHKRIFQDIQEWSQLINDPNDEKWMQ